MPEWFNVDLMWLYNLNAWSNTKLGGWVVRIIILAVGEGVLYWMLKDLTTKKKATVWGYAVLLPVSWMVSWANRFQLFDENGEVLKNPIENSIEVMVSNGFMFWLWAIGTFMVWKNLIWVNRKSIKKWLKKYGLLIIEKTPMLKVILVSFGIMKK